MRASTVAKANSQQMCLDTNLAIKRCVGTISFIVIFVTIFRTDNVVAYQRYNVYPIYEISELRCCAGNQQWGINSLVHDYGLGIVQRMTSNGMPDARIFCLTEFPRFVDEEKCFQLLEYYYYAFWKLVDCWEKMCQKYLLFSGIFYNIWK